MNLQQAKELLGINQDDEREIKRKYHNSLVKPESTDGKGQRIYHFKAFLAAPPQTVESTRIANLQPGRISLPKSIPRQSDSAYEQGTTDTGISPHGR